MNKEAKQIIKKNKVDISTFKINQIKIQIYNLMDIVKSIEQHIENYEILDYIASHLFKSDTGYYFDFKKKTKKNYIDEIMKSYTLPKHHCSCKNYTYPVTNILVQTKQEPFGSCWIHDTQTDDDKDEIYNKRLKQFEFLRAIVLPEQRSDAWFKMREGRITASDGGTVLGLNHYEPQYKFILKKTVGAPFTSNLPCYHGKKYEEIATMIYSYRMNVYIEEFGLIAHPVYYFLAASPDGICSPYKYNKKHISKYVGRMLEIKCPFGIKGRKRILSEGPVIDEICPIYYWVQVQLQLECCDLNECDFWQCDISEYKSRDDFIKDTCSDEPFRSRYSGCEKGVVIQLIPKNKVELTGEKYKQMIYDDAKIIYPPSIEMSPSDCDKWIVETLSTYTTKDEYTNYIFEQVLYWRLNYSRNITIQRNKLWFENNLNKFEKMWNYVKYLRNHQDKLDKFVRITKSIPWNKEMENNEYIMDIVDKLYNGKDILNSDLKKEKINDIKPDDVFSD